MLKRGKTVKRKKVMIIGGVILVAILVALVIPKPDSQAAMLKKYNLVAVKRMDLSEEIDATGKVIALEKKDLYSDFEGTVAKVNVKAGDRVNKGDILLTLTSTILKEQWQEANSNLKQAELNLKQAAGMAATELALNQVGKSNALQLENYYHQVALGQEQVRQAKQRLDALNAKNDGYYQSDNERLFIRAPFSGQVGWVNVQAGDKVTPQTTLGTLINPNALGVEAQIDENDVSQVKTGQKAIVIGNDEQQSQNSGVVTEISVLGRTSGEVVDFPVRIKLASNSRGLKPGMSVDVNVLAEELPNVLAVPAGAVTSQKGRDVFKVWRGKKLVEVPVELGLQHGKYSEVKSGLKPGDQVAVPKPVLSAGSTNQAKSAGFGHSGPSPFGR